jgi:hypothetical protein
LSHNISFSGAKLVLQNAAVLPAEFNLTIPSQDQRIFGVRMKWRHGNVIGVEIIHPQIANALDGSHPPYKKTLSAHECVAA